MAVQLTPNGVPSFFVNPSPGVQSAQTVVQIYNLSARRVEGQPDKITFQISDGIHCVSGFLPSQLHHLVSSKGIVDGGLHRILSYTPTRLPNGQSVIAVSSIEKLTEPMAVIGSPQAYTAQANCAEYGGGQAGAYGSYSGGGGTGSNYSADPAPYDYRDQKQYSGTPMTSSVVPVVGLNPFLNKWTIKVRVGHKSPIRTWNKETSKGKLFSVDLIDESGEIRCTMFNEAVDKFYDVFQQGKVFLVSGGTIKYANKRFSSLKHQYEISLGPTATVSQASEADGAEIPQVRFAFKSIGDLPQVEANTLVDVIGIVLNVGDVSEITVKSSGNQLMKRVLVICDTSSRSVELTLWAESANTFNGQVNSVVAVKGAKVSDWNSRSLGAGGGSLLLTGNDAAQLPEGRALLDWLQQSGGQISNVHPLSIGGGGAGGREHPLKSIGGIPEEARNGGEKGCWSDVIGTITLIKTDPSSPPWYSSCPNCKKKLVENGDMFRCEPCQKDYPEPQLRFKFLKCRIHSLRYILSGMVADETGSIWVNMFDEVATSLIGRTAKDMNIMLAENPTAWTKVFTEPVCSHYKVTIRSRNEEYNGEVRVKHSLVRLAPVDFVSMLSKEMETIGLY